MLLNLNIYSENFNNLLINSINKYHPLLLYISIFVFYFTILLFYYFLKKPNYVLFLKIQIFIKFFIQNYIKYIIFSLFLGSFWALQEGSWGGWWNWDPSEVLGLLILFFYIYFFHKKYNFLNYILYSIIRIYILFLYL